MRNSQQHRSGTVSAFPPHIDASLVIPSRTDLLEDVRAFVRDAALRFGFQEDVSEKIELAVDEACTNIIKHAYKFDPDKEIRITITTEETGNSIPSRFIIRIVDSGISFDSSHYQAPDLREYFSQMRRGGLGIVLMRKIMDEVEYGSASDNRNLITLVKYRTPAPQG